MAATIVTLRRPISETRPSSAGEVRRTVAGFAAMTALLGAAALFLPIILALAVAVPVLAVWFWKAPVRGVYVLMAGALLIEIYPLHFADSLTDRIPLFLNLNNTAGFDFPITPAEVLMITVAAVTFLRAASERQVAWPNGALVGAYTLYVVVVIGAEVHGLLAGGDFKTSLWEMRPQIYGFILFFLTTTLVQDRKQLVQLCIVFVLAVTLKAVLGDFRYFITLQRNLGVQLQVLAHEDSYFLGVLVSAGVAAMIWLRNRKVALLFAAVTPLALVAMMANSRRAGAYALAAALIVIAVFAFKFEPHLRRKIALVVVVAAVLGAGFLSYAWNKQYGLQAQLVRPVRSLIDPSVRDYSSDLYRTAENANLRLTFQTSPIIGVGFGSPYLMVYPMADISQIYPLWNVIPHNSLMWVGMRMGAVGFAAFWALIGLAVIQGFQLARRPDPLMRMVAAVAVGAIVAEVLVGYADLQLESYRNLVFLGIVLGLLNRLPQLPEVADA